MYYNMYVWLTLGPSTGTGTLLMRFEASKGGLAWGGVVVGGACVVMGKTDPNWNINTQITHDWPTHIYIHISPFYFYFWTVQIGDMRMYMVVGKLRLCSCGRIFEWKKVQLYMSPVIKYVCQYANVCKVLRFLIVWLHVRWMFWTSGCSVLFSLATRTTDLIGKCARRIWRLEYFRTKEKDEIK